MGKQQNDDLKVRVVNEKKDYLVRFNRLLVWPTLVLFILLAISGYGMTNPNTVAELTGGLFTHANSVYLHTALVLPALTLLVIHILIAIRSTLTRWGVKEGLVLNAFLVLLGAFAVTLIAIMQYVVV
jgi:cytochrome b subunit of formate dehydrogenase